MRYSLSFFNARVQAEIEAWPAGIRASFARIVELMEEVGPNLGMPRTRALGDGLFEIRAKGAEGIGRAFFCALIGRRIVILHGFIKKSQCTPKKEIEIAMKRLDEVRYAESRKR